MADDALSLESGTMVFSSGLPESLPTETQIVSEQRLSGGSLLIHLTPDGRFDFTLFLDQGFGRDDERAFRKYKVLDKLTGPRMVPVSTRDVVCSVSWDGGRFSDLYLQGQAFLRGAGAALESDALELVAKPLEGVGENFTAENEAARMRRRNRLAGWQPKPNRHHGGEDYAFSSLRDEVNQIRELLDLVGSGKEHHVLGLSSRLRLLIDGKPLGLLQMCAAYRDKALILYECRDPQAPPPALGAIYAFQLTASAVETKISCTAVDLDEWLRLPGLHLGEKIFTNLNIIKDVGDTIGSHRDIDVTQLMAALMKTPGLPTRYNDVTRFIMMAAQVMLGLADGLLADSAETAA